MRNLRVEIKAVAIIEDPFFYDAVALGFEFSLAAKNEDEFFALVFEKCVDVDFSRKRKYKRFHALVALLVRQARIVVAEGRAATDRRLPLALLHDRDRIDGEVVFRPQQMPEIAGEGLRDLGQRSDRRHAQAIFYF